MYEKYQYREVKGDVRVEVKWLLTEGKFDLLRNSNRLQFLMQILIIFDPIALILNMQIISEQMEYLIYFLL